jgi:hypothetical protein
MVSGMARSESAEFDKTALRHSGYGHRVHRDYLAHVFRWGWASKYINTASNTGGRRVIEAGCGADAPLFMSLRVVRGINQKPDFYLGVDLNKINRKTTPGTQTARRLVLKEQFNFVADWRVLLEEYGQTFDTAVSFEVIEHMTESHGDEYLRGLNAMLVPGGKLLISTPAFNGHAAKNHIREYTIDELREKIERHGFKIIDRFGTFASYNDIKRGIAETMSSDEAAVLQKVYDRARQFYGDEVMSCFLAPILPDHSRNNAWVAVKERDLD